MEGSDHHSASHSTAAPPPPSSATAAPLFFNNVCTNGTPHAQQYSEIFHSFRSGRACSIPLLDLPPFHDSSTAFDISRFVYSEIFGGFDIVDFALSCDQLFSRSDEAQHSSKSDPWSQVRTQYQSEESDSTTCSGINNYVLNGDFHQTAVSKFHMVSSGDSSVIHVPHLSSEVANDIIFRDVSSGISVETQSKTAFVPSHGKFKENGRPYGISLNPTVMSVSGPCLTTEPPLAEQTPAVNKIISTMSEYESPKINAAKSSFNVSSLEFLNVEFDTGSSGIATAEAIKEAMDTAKVKMNNVRELMERKKDGIKPFAINNMNGSERVRMVFDELISKDDVLQPKHESDYKEDKEEACTQKRTEGRRSAKSPRGDQQQSDMCMKKAEEGSGERKNEMCEKEESQCQKNVEEAIMSDCNEKKLIQSVEKKIYEKLEGATTNNRTEQKVDGCEDLKSSNLRARLGDKNIKQSATDSECDDILKNHVAEVMLMGKGRIELRSGTVFGDMESKRSEIARSFMSSQPIMKESKLNHQKHSLSSEVKEKYQREHLREFEKEREKERERELEREKKNKVQLKRLEELRERKKEKEDRIGAEADDMTEQAEVRKKQRAMAKARERLEKACAEAREKKSLSEKASTEARLRAELFARSASEKISRNLRNSGKINEAEGDSGQRSRATLERHRQTVERVAKALAEKSAWDLIAEKEQAEKNSLAESLDGDIERWSKGKEGNLCALLSTLQYILGPDSGWQSIPLTEIISPDVVKKAYRKATLCVHPDKLQQRGATMQQKYICEKVFDLLKKSTTTCCAMMRVLKSSYGYDRLGEESFSGGALAELRLTSTKEAGDSGAKKKSKKNKSHPVFSLFSSRRKKMSAKPELVRYMEYLKEGGRWDKDTTAPVIYYTN